MPVRVTGIRETKDAIARASQVISDTERTLLEWAAVADETVRASAASATTPEGDPWAPRKTSTVRDPGRAARPRSRESGTLGIKTGRMLRSILVNVGRTKARLTVGTRGARYAKYFVGYSSRQVGRAILPTHSAGPSREALNGFVDGMADKVIEAIRRG